MVHKFVTSTYQVAIWFSGSGTGCINEVALCWTQLLLTSVTHSQLCCPLSLLSSVIEEVTTGLVSYQLWVTRSIVCPLMGLVA